VASLAIDDRGKRRRTYRWLVGTIFTPRRSYRFARRIPTEPAPSPRRECERAGNAAERFVYHSLVSTNI